MNRNGMIVWRGPSLLDGSPLVVIATGLVSSSANSKTGGLVQVYILREDMHPMDVLRTGADVSICGVCPHKSKASGGSGACYVQVFRAPASIWNAYKRGSYDRPFELSAFDGKLVRFGAYGDPAAVPFEVWESIAERADKVTGYTHQWRSADTRFARYCMASADSADEGRQARKMGYRSFIVRAPGEAKQRGAVVCPASAEAGRKAQCSDCMQCGGTASGRRADITIEAHGASARAFKPLPLSVV